MSRFIGLGDRPLPGRVILTDDPMRVKMLTAHYLEEAMLVSESRGMVGYQGCFSGVSLAIFSCGWGEAAALAYLHELAGAGAKTVLFLGECASFLPALPLGRVVLARSARGARTSYPCDASLLRRALDFSRQLDIPAREHPVFTCDTFWLSSSQPNPGSEEVLDFSSSALYRYASARGLSALSVLTVAEELYSGRRMDDAFRQSRFHSAARLAFEVLADTRPF